MKNQNKKIRNKNNGIMDAIKASLEGVQGIDSVNGIIDAEKEDDDNFMSIIDFLEIKRGYTHAEEMIEVRCIKMNGKILTEEDMEFLIDIRDKNEVEVY